MSREISATDQKLLSAGGLAGLLFCGVAIHGILTRPAFDLQRHAVSNLSLGEQGWTMVTAFIGSGALVLLCAVGLAHILTEGRGRRALPILVGIYGLGLIIAGIFPPPVCCGFPAGTPEDLQPVMTTSAILHSVGFMVAFSSLIIAAFVAAARLKGGWSTLSLAAGLAMPLLVGLGMGGVVAPGIAFFAAAIIGWAWLGSIVLPLADGSAHGLGDAAPSLQ